MLVTVTEAKARSGEMIREATEEDVVVVRHGHPAAVLVGAERYGALLEELERPCPGSDSGKLPTDRSARAVGQAWLESKAGTWGGQHERNECRRAPSVPPTRNAHCETSDGPP
jgi:prevent-host-death family protein